MYRARASLYPRRRSRINAGQHEMIAPSAQPLHRACGWRAALHAHAPCGRCRSSIGLPLLLPNGDERSLTVGPSRSQGGGESLRERTGLLQREPRGGMHHEIRRERHFTFEERLCRFARLRIVPIPLRKVEHAPTVFNFTLHEPGDRGYVGVPRPTAFRCCDSRSTRELRADGSMADPNSAPE